MNAIAELAKTSELIKTRRFELVPLRGPQSPFTKTQGRGWGTTITDSPTELIDLISSIGTVGLIQPISVEELPSGHKRVISGHRRFAAMRIGTKEQPDNPHFAAMATNIFTGPLDGSDICTWQLVENLARTDLQPGELAAALLYHRSALLVALLKDHNVTIPADLAGLDDPAARWDHLNKLRQQNELHHIGISWETAISRIGLELSADKARKLVAAFRAMPTELATEMDQHQISLNSRANWIRLHRNGRAQAAEDIWAAVKAKNDARRLLSHACITSLDNPDMTGTELADNADQKHQEANQARAIALTPTPTRPEDPETTDLDLDQPDLADSETETVPTELITRIRNDLQELERLLTGGTRIDRYDKGSLQLLLTRSKTLLASQDAVCSAQVKRS